MLMNSSAPRWEELRASPLIDLGEVQNLLDLEAIAGLLQRPLPADPEDLSHCQLRGTLEHVEQRLRSQSLPALKSPAAYFKDALKKGYAGVKGAVPPAALPPAVSARPASALRGESACIGSANCGITTGCRRPRPFTSKCPKPCSPRCGPASRLNGWKSWQVRSRAWRRDGPGSRIAATTFHRWLAQITWPEEPSDRVLLDFALAQGGGWHVGGSVAHFDPSTWFVPSKDNDVGALLFGKDC
jgi:hypothetical protein